MSHGLEGTFLVVADTPEARQTLRNICNAYERAVARRFGRAVLFEGTELGAFLAFRLQIKHGTAVSIQRTVTVDESRDRYRRAYEAAAAFEARDHESTPYPKFATGTDHPMPAEMDEREVTTDGTTDGDETDDHRLTPTD